MIDSKTIVETEKQTFGFLKRKDWWKLLVLLLLIGVIAVQFISAKSKGGITKSDYEECKTERKQLTERNDQLIEVMIRIRESISPDPAVKAVYLDTLNPNNFIVMDAMTRNFNIDSAINDTIPRKRLSKKDSLILKILDSCIKQNRILKQQKSKT